MLLVVFPCGECPLPQQWTRIDPEPLVEGVSELQVRSDDVIYGDWHGKAKAMAVPRSSVVVLLGSLARLPKEDLDRLKDVEEQEVPRALADSDKQDTLGNRRDKLMTLLFSAEGALVKLPDASWPSEALEFITLARSEKVWFHDLLINAAALGGRDLGLGTLFPFWDVEVIQAAIGGLHAMGHQPTEPSDEAAELLLRLEKLWNVVLEGVAGSGKSHLVEALVDGGAFASTDWVVFHPATSYEDFVEGLRPSGSEFTYTEGRFLEACRRAADKPAGKHLIVIDEINRANAARVLGDLLYCIEPSKRVPPELAAVILESKVETRESWWPAGVARLGLPNDDGERGWICVPKNLFVIGTMNTTDRSVGTIDLALRRRFTFIRQPLLSPDELSKEVPDLSDSAEAWGRLNGALQEKVGPDAQLGHSYFFSAAAFSADRDERTKILWERLLLPQLVEILAAFNAFKHVGHLLAATKGEIQVSSFDPPFWLEVVGEGLDRYALVVENARQSSKGAAKASSEDGSGDRNERSGEAIHSEDPAAGLTEPRGGEDAGGGDS